MACTADACKQGRMPCPCPEACQMPVQMLGDDPADRTAVVIAVLSLALVVASAVIAYLIVGA